MRPNNTANCHASEGDGAERSAKTGIVLKAASINSDCTLLTYIPEHMTRLQAVDSACQNCSIQEVNNINYELNINCNHNGNYEPLPNEGCGCSGSYNGGAGGGTASCCDTGDELSIGGPSNYGSVRTSYTPEFHGPLPQCPPHHTSCFTPLPPKYKCCPYDANTYHRPRNNTTPQCMDKYLPDNSYTGCDPCTSECPDTYELVRNTDAQRYKGRGPDRSNYFADDCYQGC